MPKGCSIRAVLDAQGPWSIPHLSSEAELTPWRKLIKIKLTVALLSRRVAFLLFQEHAQFILAMGPLHAQFPLLEVLASDPRPSQHWLLWQEE